MGDVEQAVVLLEAERAGVVVSRNLLAEARDPELVTLLETVLEGERESCRVLGRQILAMGARAGAGVGDFVGKVMALSGMLERLSLLVRGQKWVVKRLDELLAGWSRPFGREELEGIRKVHLANIAACEIYLANKQERSQP